MAALLEMTDICKRFGGTVALDHVSFSAEAGEVHALLGENGAGKSTLMKILVGALRRDSGGIRLAGDDVEISSITEARRLGIVEIFQELTILPELTVAQNIFLSRESTHAGLLNHAEMNRRARDLLADVGLDIDVKRRAGNYSVAQQQMIEIARALSCNARIVIMDEPTSCLTPGEVGVLFRAIRRITARGTTVIYISHRLGEILEIANRATVLRDGALVATMPVTPNLDRAAIVRQMIGRAWSDEFPARHATIGKPLLQVRGLTRNGAFDGVDLDVRAGEVVGLFGLLGAGRTEVVRAIFGADAYDSGEIEVSGEPFRPRSCRHAIKNRLALVPEDRKAQGIHLQMSVQQNTTLAVLPRLSRGGLLLPQRVRACAADLATRLGIRASSLDLEAYALSGGNQQKVILAKWLATGARVFLLDEPTRGIDVEAKREVYRLINSLAEAGCGILLVSSESEEILGMSDRILVMFKGRICTELSREQATDELLLHYATGAGERLETPVEVA